MSEKNQNELAVNAGFAVLANQDVLNEALADDCQGLEFSFDRVKLPAGGGTAFEIPSADGEDAEMAKDITGVIVYNHPAFAYYHDKYNGGSNPPDCGSFDGVSGIGNPGGSCHNCPYNKFGSGDGQSKLCKNKRIYRKDTAAGGAQIGNLTAAVVRSKGRSAASVPAGDGIKRKICTACRIECPAGYGRKGG
jgi:hypothetical protein